MQAGPADSMRGHLDALQACAGAQCVLAVGNACTPEALADIIWTTRQQVRTAAIIQSQLPLPSGAVLTDVAHAHGLLQKPRSRTSLPRSMRCWLSSCTGIASRRAYVAYTAPNRTFLVDEQPPRVLKTQSKFEASVRFLVGAKLNVHMDLPTVADDVALGDDVTHLCRWRSAS